MRTGKGEPTVHFCTTRVLTTYMQIPASSTCLLQRAERATSSSSILPHPFGAACIFESSAARSPCLACRRVVLPHPERIRSSDKVAQFRTAVRRLRLPAFNISCTAVYADTSSTWLAISATGWRFSNTYHPIFDPRQAQGFFAGFAMPTQCELDMLDMADVVLIVLAAVPIHLFSGPPHTFLCYTARRLS